MLSFINKFSPEYSPSHDEKVISEFQRAHEAVRQFKQRDEKVEACFEKIRADFSEETYNKYPRDVDAFLRCARTELEYRVSAIGTDVLLSPPPVSPYLQGYLYEFARFVSQDTQSQATQLLSDFEEIKPFCPAFMDLACIPN